MAENKRMMEIRRAHTNNAQQMLEEQKKQQKDG